MLLWCFIHLMSENYVMQWWKNRWETLIDCYSKMNLYIYGSYSLSIFTIFLITIWVSLISSLIEGPMEAAYKNSALSSKFAFEYCAESRSPKHILIYGCRFLYLEQCFLHHIFLLLKLGFMWRSQRRGSYSLIEASLTFENKPSQNHCQIVLLSELYFISECLEPLATFSLHSQKLQPINFCFHKGHKYPFLLFN